VPHRQPSPLRQVLGADRSRVDPGLTPHLAWRRRFTAFACLPSAERTSLGRRLIVLLRFEATTAF
jgi:hypothetical protein